MSAPETDRATRKRQQQRWLAAVNVVLFLGLAFQLNYLSYRHYERWDWTEHDLYTLSDRSKAVLEQLDQPVQLFILMSEQDPAFRDLQNLLERYRTETDRLDVQYVDPERDPGRYREVSQRFATGEVGALGLPTDVVAVIAVGERHRTIERNDLVHQSFDPMGDEDTIELDVQSERSLTGAIVDLTQAEPTTLCVSAGHGELALEGGERSLSGFADQIRGDSVELEQLETRGQSRVPARCDALAIIGPQIAFPEAEADVIRRYVRDGGNLLVALEPVPTRDQTGFISLGLEDMLRDFGVRADRNLVVEPNGALLPAEVGHPVGPYFVVGWGEHRVVEPFRGLGLPLVISDARSVRPVEGAAATTLFSTSEQSYAFSQAGAEPLGRDQAEVQGPVSLGVAARVELTGQDAPEEDETDEEASDGVGGRLVVLGDATMFESRFMGQPTIVNANLATAVVGWLTQREALISIEGRSIEQRQIRMSEEDVGGLFLRVVVLIPLAFIFLGFAVWWNRRQ